MAASVNANNSLFGYSSTGLPTGEYFIWVSGRRITWTGAEYQPFLSLTTTAGDGYLQASTQGAGIGNISYFYSGSEQTIVSAGASSTAWWNFGIRRRDIGGGSYTHDVCWVADNGTTLNKATIGDKGTPLRLTLLNYDTGGEQSDNVSVRSCGVYNFNPSDIEILAQLRQEDPIYGDSSLLNRFYRLNALGSFGTDLSGNGRNLTTSGTGTTDSTEPVKNGKTYIIWGSSVARGTYSGGLSIYGWVGGQLQSQRVGDLIIDRTSNGTKTPALTAAYSTDIAPLVVFPSSKIVVFSEQINHVWNDGSSSGRPTARQAADAVWDAASPVLSAGAKFFPCTSTPVNDAIQTILADCNTLLLAEWGAEATSIVNAGAIAEFNTGWPNSEYDTDQDTHLKGDSSTLGYARLTNYLDAVLDDPPAPGVMVSSMNGTGSLAATPSALAAMTAAQQGSGQLGGLLGALGNRSSAMTATGTLAGTLVGIGSMVSSESGTGALGGTLVGSTALVCSTGGSGSLAGTLIDGTGYTVAFTGAGSLGGTLAATGAMACSTGGTGTLGGFLQGLVSIASSAGGAGVLAGALGATGALQVPCSASGALQGFLQGLVSIASTTAGTGSLGGALTATGALASPLSGQGGLAGTCSGVGALACAASATGVLGGTLAGLAQRSAPLVGTGALAGTLTDGAILSVPFVGSGALGGTLTGLGTMVAALPGQGALVATLRGLAGASAACSAGGSLGAVLVGQASASCALAGQATLQGTGQAAAYIAASLSGGGVLACMLAGAGLMSVSCVGAGDASGALSGIGSLVVNLVGLGFLDATANASTPQVQVGILQIALVHSRGQCVVEEEQRMAKFYADTDRVLHLVFTDRAGKAIDLTDLTIEFVWRYQPTGFRVRKTTGDGIEIQTQTGNGLGKASIEIARADTKRVRQYTQAEYEIAVTDSEGRRDVWGRGLIPIEPSISTQ